MMTGYPRPYRLTIHGRNITYYQWHHGPEGKKNARGKARDLAASSDIRKVVVHNLTADGWQEVERHE